jgi:transposase InsO family protein
LELLAAVVSVHLDATIKKELDLNFDESIFWSDSTIVLHYVKNKTKRFHTFVGNRIATIHEQSSPEQWRHVPTAQNPADDASRGLSAAEMVNSSRWLQGPVFLKKKESEWPENVILTSESDVLANDVEVRGTAKVYEAKTTNTRPTDPLNKLLSRYSDWFKLQKAIVWFMRFMNYLHTKQVTRLPITVGEMREASKCIVRSVQSQAFSTNLKMLARLNPIQEEGILKVGGRIDRAPVSYELRHPIILPSEHPVTESIINYYHKLNGHLGLTHVLAAIREKFWIIKGCASVRRVLRKCIPCKIRNAPKGNQQMASLPKERLIPDKSPFTFTGVDYFGPMFVKQGRNRVKRYGCIFTCFTTRAVHLEVAHTLELNSFLCALTRFISRRGKPEIMFSDNGTNFQGGNREIREAIKSWNEQQLNKNMIQRDIEWKFNPPHASHMGGVWERLIRSTKRILSALMKEQVVSDEILLTVVTEAERILNDRPISSIGEDVTDPEPLSPSKLLLLRSNTCFPLGVFCPRDQYARRWWRQAQYLANIFWRRWTREYLPILQERQKWIEPKKNFKENDLVLVVDENLPRGQWPLGRVIEAYPDQDDAYVRTAKVKTMESVKIRPIHKLIHLEDSNTWNETKKGEPEDMNVTLNANGNPEAKGSKNPVRIKRKPRKYDDFLM